MARFLLLPGFGGSVDQVVPLTSGAGAVYTDELDVAYMAQISVQVKTWAAGNLAVQVQQTLDGTHFSNVGDPQTLVQGDIIRIPTTSGPLGIIRYALTSSDTSASVTLTTVGFPMQWSN